MELPIWNQSESTLSLTFRLPIRVFEKDVDLLVSPYFVKVNVTKCKFIRTVDLFDEVEFKEFRTVVNDFEISIYLNKKLPKHWENLVNIDKQSAKEKRDLSLKAFEEFMKEIHLQEENIKKEVSKIALDQGMGKDKEFRDILKNQKKKEKDAAEKEIYDGIKAIENRKQEQTALVNKAAIRESSNIPVNLTKKKVAHFAARESLTREPPFPKSKRLVVDKDGQGKEIQDRNPIWLKEKADNFFKNKDYRSAINAYDKILRLTNKQHRS